MKQIQLTKGAFSLVDDEDYEWLMQWKWQLNGWRYAVRSKHLGGMTESKKSYKKKTVFLHHEISKVQDGFQIDHINGDTLDNRKENLRIVSGSQNCMNRKSRKGTSSKYKGVSWFKRESRWIVQIMKDGKNIYLGSFPLEKEIEAAIVYDQSAIKYYGEFARLNFPMTAAK